MVVVFAGCDDDKPDTPEVAAAKADCKTLLEHIVQISPQGQGKDPKAVVDSLPIEDIQGCTATDPLIRRCMGAAKDVAAVKACPGECIGTLSAYRAFKRKNAKIEDDKSSPTIDTALFPFVDKCLAGDAKAADGFKLEHDKLVGADPLPSI
jgi:hypothetical protein